MKELSWRKWFAHRSRFSGGIRLPGWHGVEGRQEENRRCTAVEPESRTSRTSSATLFTSSCYAFGDFKVESHLAPGSPWCSCAGGVRFFREQGVRRDHNVPGPLVRNCLVSTAYALRFLRYLPSGRVEIGGDNMYRSSDLDHSPGRAVPSPSTMFRGLVLRKTRWPGD